MYYLIRATNMSQRCGNEQCLISAGLASVCGLQQSLTRTLDAATNSWLDSVRVGANMTDEASLSQTKKTHFSLTLQPRPRGGRGGRLRRGFGGLLGDDLLGRVVEERVQGELQELVHPQHVDHHDRRDHDH